MPKRLLTACLLWAGILSSQTQPIRNWADADKQESELAAKPTDAAVRVNLLRYYSGQGQQSPDRVKPLRLKHILWFIENDPSSPYLGEYATTLDKAGYPYADPDGYAKAAAVWSKAMAASKPLADTYANAIYFYRVGDPARAREIAGQGLQRYPGHARISERKGMLLAYSAVGVKTLDQYGRAASFDEPHIDSPEGRADREALEAAEDPNLAGGAANVLAQQVYALNSRNLTDRLKTVKDLTILLYQHAIQVEPNDYRWKTGLTNAYQSFANVVAKSTAEKIDYLEKALAIALNAMQRATVLPDLAQAYFTIGNDAKASECANELLNSNLDRSNWNYGNTVFTANTVLGRIALKKGDQKEAARYLLAAGHAPSTPQLSSFGPTDWRLAEDLLGAGDRDTVLAYLDLVRDTWKSGASRVDGFVATIRSGGTPNFTGTSQFQKARYVGRPAPEFRLKDLHDSDVALSEFKGKVVIVDFWATWCGPCRAEMPDLQKIHHELSSQDVVVLAVDVNEPKETVAEYVEKEKLTMPVLLANGTDVMDRYGVHAYPTTFFLDKNGLVADVLEGSGTDNATRLRSVLAKARAGAPPPGPEPPPVVSAARTPAVPPPNSTTAEDFYRDAARQHTAKDYAGAVKSLDRALQLRPDWTLAVINRADNLFHARQYDESIKAWTHAIELDPKRAASYDGRALAYSNSKRHAEALPDYARAIELQPDFAAAHNNRGWALLDLGRLDESLADLNKAIELNPTYSVALFNRAHLYVKRGDFAKAVADFDAVLHVTPGDTQATTQKASALRELQGNAALPAPKPLSPAPGEVLEHYPRDTTVVWSEVPGAMSYMVEWDYQDSQGWASDRNAPFPAIRTQVPVATFKFVGAQPGRWRVWAIDASGAAGPKSDWREFRYTK
jgi:tetratricopeptide (TPR) repeat protein/thiol-disulfide isomerase/thioredoxin